MTARPVRAALPPQFTDSHTDTLRHTQKRLLYQFSRPPHLVKLTHTLTFTGSLVFARFGGEVGGSTGLTFLSGCINICRKWPGTGSCSPSTLSRRTGVQGPAQPFSQQCCLGQALSLWFQALFTASKKGRRSILGKRLLEFGRALCGDPNKFLGVGRKPGTVKRNS